MREKELQGVAFTAERGEDGGGAAVPRVLQVGVRTRDQGPQSAVQLRIITLDALSGLTQVLHIRSLFIHKSRTSNFEVLSGIQDI